MKKYFGIEEVYIFSGKLSSGKNFICENIFLPMLEEKPTLIISFADHFKVETINKDKISYDRIYLTKDEESRTKLQKRGTKEGRELFGEDIWVNTLKTWARVYGERGIKRICICDGRFENEINCFDGLVEILIKIRINSPERNHQALLRESKGDMDKYQQIANHLSETALDTKLDLFHYILNNDPQYNAFIQARDIIKEIEEKNKHEMVIFCDLDDTICECAIYYEKQLKTLYDECIKYVKVNNDIEEKEFYYKFYEQYHLHEGNYHQFIFTLDRYANALVNIVKGVKDNLVISDKQFKDLKIKAYQLGMEVFDYNYEQISNNSELLKKLSNKYKIVIVTMGNRKEQLKKIAYLGLSNIEHHITHNKNVDSFIYLKEKYKAKEYVMIGDSYYRDILPAIQADIENVFWIKSEHKEIPDDISVRVEIINNFEAAYSLILEENN